MAHDYTYYAAVDSTVYRHPSYESLQEENLVHFALLNCFSSFLLSMNSILTRFRCVPKPKSQLSITVEIFSLLAMSARKSSGPHTYSSATFCSHRSEVARVVSRMFLSFDDFGFVYSP